MRRSRAPHRWVRVVVLLLALGFAALPSQAQPAVAQATADERPLTPEQETSIREEMAALYGVLVQGGKSPQEAKLAVHAVGICFGAAYAHGLTRAQATAICGEVLDAFTIQPGATRYELTSADRAWINSRVMAWTTELAGLLEPDELAAVQSTMQACLEGHMRRGEDRDGAVKRCALGVLPLLSQPGLRDFVLNAASGR